jgi:WD40 repeat protein
MRRHGILLCALILCVSVPASPQQNCPLPPSLQSVPLAENIFSDQQEVDLGDAMAEAVALHVNVIQSDDLTAHLREVGNRLVQYLPPTRLNFRFYLIDLPQVNAFSIAGGRVYVSRKIVAFAHNDDELAGILAHELGHIVTHQSAIEITRAFREILNVTQVGSRDDVFRKFHQYVENVSRQRHPGRGEEEKHQIVADQVSVYALARAGFSVQAFPEFWDKFAELHGKTGNWVTDLFGSTTPAQHRLRDMIKNMAALPPGCSDHATSANETEFKAWQAVVVDYDNGTRSEILPGLISKHRLSVRLRPEITNLRFSPNGKYILAQDDGGIHLVSRDPFAFLFYIPAPDAHQAKFSSDSKSIVFSTTDLRVEVWGVAEQKRTSVHEITVRAPCMQTELSPDGSVLACLNTEHTLQLIDVTNGLVIHEEKRFLASVFRRFDSDVVRCDPRKCRRNNVQRFRWFSKPGIYARWPLFPWRFWNRPHGTAFEIRRHRGVRNVLSTQWSPARPPGLLLFDIRSHSKLSAPASIQNEVGLSFAFLGSDRIVGVNHTSPQKSHILKFPSGETVGGVEFWQGLNLRAAAHGDSLLVGPLKDYPLGVMDLATKENKILIKQNAADMFDGVFLTEQFTGQLAMHTKENPEPLGVLALPEGGLGRLHVSAASGDLRLLAVSSKSRGAVWDVPHDLRAVQMPNFNALGFDGAAIYVDVPEFQGSPRQTAEVHLDTGAHTFHPINKDEIAVQHGLYMIVTKPRKEGNGSSKNDLDVRDFRSGTVLWSRYFPDELPFITFDVENDTALLRWRVSQTAARKELKGFPELNRRADKKDDYLCEILDAKSGNVLSALILKTNNGSLRYLRTVATPNWAVAQAAGDQIINYALPSGEEQGHFFGANPVISAGALLAVDSSKWEVTVYDLTSSEPRQQYTFARPVVCKMFSADGKRLLVFTADQTVYLFDVATTAPRESALLSN